MPTSPNTLPNRTSQVTTAWENVAPDKPFGGFTLTKFKAAVQPSLDVRDKIAGLESQISAAYGERDNADAESSAALQLVVNGVKGDPAFGEDSPLYEAMGYVRKSARKSGLTKKSAASAVTKLAA